MCTNYRLELGNTTTCPMKSTARFGFKKTIIHSHIRQTAAHYVPPHTEVFASVPLPAPPLPDAAVVVRIGVVVLLASPSTVVVA